eukprot:COSAG05_NODE_573_length_8601_cov_58.330981_10_plen_189_part_00
MRYGGADGPDIDAAAALSGLGSADAVIAAHADATYRVYFLGFTGGFPYLGGLPAALAAVPRLDTPRQAVPQGAVGIAAGQTGVPSPRSAAAPTTLFLKVILKWLAFPIYSSFPETAPQRNGAGVPIMHPWRLASPRADRTRDLRPTARPAGAPVRRRHGQIRICHFRPTSIVLSIFMPRESILLGVYV